MRYSPRAYVCHWFVAFHGATQIKPRCGTRDHLAILLLLTLIAGCAETHSKRTTSGSSSSGTAKVVTATPTETFDCDDDLILEPHLPEECIPPEPVVQQPLEPPKPDPIVGTYQLFYTSVPERRGILRVYPNNRANYGYRWERESDTYYFYSDRRKYEPAQYEFSTEYTDLAGEPELKRYEGNTRWEKWEAVKLSDNPDHLFDHFRLTALPSYSHDWKCVNVGRKQEIGATLAHDLSWTHNQTDFAGSLEECEALCPEAVQKRPEFGVYDSCPQDRRVSLQDFVGTYVIDRNIMVGWDSVLRVERDGIATIIGRGNYTWAVSNGEARFYWGFSRSPTFEKGELAFSIGIRGSGNERDFRQTFGSGWEDFSPIKQSDDPNHQSDFYILRHGKDRPEQGNTIESWCSNIGREEISGFPWGWSKGAPPTTSRDILECLDSCVELRNFYSKNERDSARKAAAKMYCP